MRQNYQSGIWIIIGGLPFSTGYIYQLNSPFNGRTYIVLLVNYNMMKYLIKYSVTKQRTLFNKEDIHLSAVARI